jgi:hypothetical protein
MSKKILVLDDRQFQELKRIFDAKMPTPWVMEDLENTNFYYSILFAFECAEKENRSVLEWHPMSEAPSSDAGCVLVEYSVGGFGFAFGHTENIKDDPDYKRWSYLPE